MITILRSGERGGGDHGWLRTIEGIADAELLIFELS
jgi:hypothetical protein